MNETTKTGHSVHFLQRVLEALDCDIAYLAKELGIPYQDLLDIWKGSRLKIIAVDQDAAWVKIADYVDLRIGAMLSVREELQRKLNLERKQRAIHRLRIERR